MNFTRIGHLKTVDAFKENLSRLGLDLPCDDGVVSTAAGSPMGLPIGVDGLTIGNRWCVHPMEGWDANPDGTPSEHTLRRWQHFGESGAKLIWGGEAFAVQEDGRSNPRQSGIVAGDYRRGEKAAADLLDCVKAAHRNRFGTADGLAVGLQLTHSGRYSVPHDTARREPVIAYHHPVLDRRCGIPPTDDSAIATDDYLHRLVESFIEVAKSAQRVGYDFVDIKACHGYLGHELLSGYTRKGTFGGSFENRTQFLRLIIDGIRAQCPGLRIGVRLSAFDTVPYKPDPTRSVGGKLGPGIPEEFPTPYPYAFGLNQNNPLEIDLTETIQLIHLLTKWGVKLINVTAGSPYYCPHIQRPAMFPPSDGYQPPEDPLIGVYRQIQATRQIKAACPGAILIGTGYTYLQDYLPHVAQAVVREGWTDLVGIGRMVLSYWDIVADSLEGKGLRTNRVCRTFSDCTSAPRAGLISGCYPLDRTYKAMPEFEKLKAFKATKAKS